MEEKAPLYQVWVEQPRTTINRLHILFHGCLVLALLYYRIIMILSATGHGDTVALSLLFFAEVLLFFLWVLSQPFRWRPVARRVFPERLPDDQELPEIDVFVCTADPEKEPVVQVMNTVISAMALDYPQEKLSVYLSDDGGSSSTLNALREAFSFASLWLPFCRKYGIVARSPEAYFLESSGQCTNYRSNATSEFCKEREEIEMLYVDFKERIGNFQGRRDIWKDQLSRVEIIHGKSPKNERAKMPMLVYVSREHSQTIHHHFKAGALNVLLRVSSLISNAPYILVMDCDMRCNDPSSARQAMCFHLDPKFSTNLAFVQFPQAFGNLSSYDIYGGEMRWIFKILLRGLDGLSGPLLSGTGFYIKRAALSGLEPPKFLGQTTREVPSLDLKDAQAVASCTYEQDTKWGTEIGFLYGSVVEDFFTGFNLHCRGWKSVYCSPSRPAFVGSATTNLADTLVQNKRYSSGLLEVAFSRSCPLIYGLAKSSILQNLCYACFAFMPLHSVVLCHAIVPPLCFLNGISVYPKVSSPWFLVFLGVYLSYAGQHLLDTLTTGGSIMKWWHAERNWMINTASADLMAILEVIMKLLGIRNVEFELTNKVIDEEQEKRYSKGIYDFQGTGLMILPHVVVANVNVVCLIGGVWRMVRGSSQFMLGQVLLILLTLALGYPLIEGVMFRKDRGRVPLFITLGSVPFIIVILSLVT